MERIVQDVSWTEERIREEMARLDGKTKLHGAELPIKFNRARKTLGSFMPTIWI